MQIRIMGRTRLAPILLVFLALFTLPVAPVLAQSLRVVEGGTSSTLRVPMNRAVVVESDAPFAELSIANPGIADIATLSETSIYVLGRTPGRTTMTLLSLEGRLIANVEVQVVPDVTELRERLREILPNDQIEVRTANDGIVLSGRASSLAAAESAMQLADRYAPGRVSNLLTVGGAQQVMLQVRFSEMSRNVRQTLSSSFSGGASEVLTGTGNLIEGTGFAAPTLPSGLASNGALLGRQGALSVTFGAGAAQMGILLEALEVEGLVRTLAEPNLTALSGEPAKFLAGGEFPVPVQTNNGPAIEFKEFGIQLNFTPTVVSDGVINLQLDTEVSSLGETVTLVGNQVPSLRTRSASTTVEMRDGESFAIAGLLQDDFRNSIGQVPWLGDLPVIGALFRSASYQREQTELVIIVTAHLVSPTTSSALALPTDRVTIPTESDLFLLGRTTGAGRGGAAGDVARQDFSGSYGYVME